MGLLPSRLTPGQSLSGSNGYEQVLHITQSSSSGASPSNSLLTYLGHLLARGLTPLLQCSRRILMSHPTGL